ncbi:LrgB-like family-domain-containing protein [Lipomyces arxii]|uniref:LrgB-like family-domain-containing protein n=1 Tax=Lipomyces arxii TaxID=56418 RepID=UPI0034D01AF3
MVGSPSGAWAVVAAMTHINHPQKQFLIDGVNAISLTLYRNAYRLFRSYILVPIGVIFTLCCLYGVHRIILLTTVNFPASVVCMLLLFGCMLLIDATLGPRRTAIFAKVIDVPLGFSLRWINTFFTPSFVLLPLSPAVSGAEIGKIAAVFVLGFMVTMAFTSYFVLALQKLLGTSRRAIVERAEEVPPPRYDENTRRGSQSNDLSEAIELDSLEPNQILGVNNSERSSTHHIMPLERPEPAVQKGLTDSPETWMNRRVDSELASMSDADSINSLNPIPTRLSSASYRSSSDLHRTRTMDTIKRVLTGSHVATHTESEDHALTQAITAESLRRDTVDANAGHLTQASGLAIIQDQEETTSRTMTEPESQSENVTIEPEHSDSAILQMLLIGKPTPRAEFMAALATRYLDTFLYITVFFCVGLPVYFTTGYTLIAHCTLTILMLFIGLRLPATVRRVIHPIFTCSGFTIFGIFVVAEANHKTIYDGLHAYSTGRTYLTLWGVPEYRHVLPGAGDMLRTLLDVSIVALAMPMYRYRADLKKHFVVIIIPNVVVGLITFFAYPPLCYAIGISAERSISFIGRSVTLALALPVVQSLGGSESLVAVVAILSGIIGVLIGGFILKWLRIREDDYLTRGITLGINSSAVATAHLLTVDPRASALSSLSFVMFGTTLIVLSAINPIVHVMRHMVGLQ